MSVAGFRQVFHPETGEAYRLYNTKEFLKYIEKYYSFNCSHEKREIRRRVLKNGSVQYREQCLICGRSAANPIPKSKAPKETVAWDDNLQFSFDIRRKKAEWEIFGSIFVNKRKRTVKRS